MIDYFFKGVPFQLCSDNDCYVNVPGRGRQPTIKLSNFKKIMEGWAFENSKKITTAKKELTKETPISMTIIQGLPHSRIWTKKNTIKRFDSHQWIKHLIDCFCLYLGIDDRQIWQMMIEKTEISKETPENSIWITKWEPREYYKL